MEPGKTYYCNNCDNDQYFSSQEAAEDAGREITEEDGGLCPRCLNEDEDE